jgi:hypothetical protein
MTRSLRAAGWAVLAGGALLVSVRAGEEAGIPERHRLSNPSSVLKVQTRPGVRIRKIGKLNDGKPTQVAVSLERWFGPGDWEPATAQVRTGELVKAEVYSSKRGMKIAFETPWVFQGLETRETPCSHEEDRLEWVNGVPAGRKKVVVQDPPARWTEAVFRDPETGAVLRVKLGEELP